MKGKKEEKLNEGQEDRKRERQKDKKKIMGYKYGNIKRLKTQKQRKIEQ